MYIKVDIEDGLLEWVENNENLESTYALKDAGTYSSEVAHYNDKGNLIEGEVGQPRRIRVKCPHCEKKFSPMKSNYTELYSSGWTWVGQSHKEPYAKFVTRCSKCKRILRLTIRSPQ